MTEQHIQIWDQGKQRAFSNTSKYVSLFCINLFALSKKFVSKFIVYNL